MKNMLSVKRHKSTQSSLVLILSKQIYEFDFDFEIRVDLPGGVFVRANCPNVLVMRVFPFRSSSIVHARPMEEDKLQQLPGFASLTSNDTTIQKCAVFHIPTPLITKSITTF